METARQWIKINQLSTDDHQHNFSENIQLGLYNTLATFQYLHDRGISIQSLPGIINYIIIDEKLVFMCKTLKHY